MSPTTLTTERIAVLATLLFISACAAPLEPPSPEPDESIEPLVLGTFVQVRQHGAALPVERRDPLLPAPEEGTCYELPDSSRIHLAVDSIDLWWWGRLDCHDGLRDASGHARRAVSWRPDGVDVIRGTSVTVCDVCIAVFGPCNPCWEFKEQARLELAISGDTLRIPAASHRTVVDWIVESETTFASWNGVASVFVRRPP